MHTFARSLLPLALLSTLVPASGCSIEPSTQSLSSPFRALRPEGAELVSASGRPVLGQSVTITPARSFATAPGAWARPPDVTTPPEDPPAPPTPIDCHDGLAVVVPSGALELVSFAGGFDTWAATYTVAEATGPQTYFVAIDGQGHASSPPRAVPLGTRVTSFGYQFLLVGPSVAETFLAVEGWGTETVTDAAVWPPGLDPEARVIQVHGAPNRCSYEASLVVESAAGRSVLAVHRGSDLAVTVTRLFDLPAVPEGSVSVLAFSTTEVLEILTAEGSPPSVRVHRMTGESWEIAAEIPEWTDGPGRSLAASRSWDGWNVLGTNTSEGRTRWITHLADDGTTSAPTEVAPDGMARAGLGVMTTNSDTTLFAMDGRVGAVSYGTLTREEFMPLGSPLVAWHGSGDMAAIGVSPEGLAVRCFRQDTLRAPAP